MTRVTSAATAVRTRRSSSAIAKRNVEKKQYKVEYKLVTAQKKQLKISNNPAPPTYVFVAAGSEAFTNYCKDICRKTGRTVHASQSSVDPTRRARVVNDPNRVGYYIGRDGFFFPADVVQKACNWFAVRIDAAGKTTEPNDYLSTRVRNALGKHGQRDERQQIEAAVREMFPKIPQEAANKIITHAFESAPLPGQKKPRVGNARDLDLAGRVQLAVNAHIRHLYTNYDQLLKDGMPWADARATIGPTCVAILRHWMDEDNLPELEETFQEWIDLRDDDEDDEDASSIEEVSDSEPRRISLNDIHSVHEVRGIAEPSRSQAPAHSLGRDSRTVRYRPDPEHPLPSIESPTNSETGRRRPASYHGLRYVAPPPPAPTPPVYRVPTGSAHERYALPAVLQMRRVDSDRSAHRRADLIDLTSSPTFPRGVDIAGQHRCLPRTVPLRGGEGNARDDLRRQPSGQTLDDLRRVVDPQPLMNLAYPEPPHPAVPRTGWVTYHAVNRQGEAVRLWYLRGTGHSHEGYCRQCEALIPTATGGSKRSRSPSHVPSSPGRSDSVIYVASNAESSATESSSSGSSTSVVFVASNEI